MADLSKDTERRLDAPEIYLADTYTAKGRGVFAKRGFADGEIVEECPVVLFQMPFPALPEELKKLVFNWGILAQTIDSQALALGFGSMYNHGDPANMQYAADPKRLTLRFIAVRNINAGEELTINYNAIGGGASWHDNNWFERMNVQPVAKKAPG